MSRTAFEVADDLLDEAQAVAVTHFDRVIVRLLALLVRHVLGGQS